MARFLVGLVVSVALVIGALYYYLYAPKLEELRAARREASLSAQEASALRSQVTDLDDMLAQLRQTSSELEAKVREKEQELASVKATQDELIGELQHEIAEGQIQVERLRDSLRVDMVDEILFDSGHADIKPEGLAVLRRVGGVLKKAEGKQIIVQGHTDNVPIVGRLAERYPTNWELSAARAVNVTRFLQGEVGIDPSRLSAVAFSEYHPRADNSTAQGRQKNRRIEILLAPLTGFEKKAETQPPGGSGDGSGA